MKSVRYHSYGDSDVLVYEDAERPVAGSGQVLVKVAGTAFNPADAGIRGGYLRQAFPVTFPHIPNFDLSGVITEVGAGVSGWNPGDAVVAFLPMDQPGAAAEYAVAPAESLAAAPRTVDLADAAALPSSGLTAWQALYDEAELKAGQRILINGASGAVGGYAVQLARQTGAVVTATGDPRSADRLRSQGAEQIIDYTATPLSEAVDGQRFDVVLTLVRDSLTDLVADGGTFLSTIPGPVAARPGVRTVQVFVRSDAAELAGLVARVDAGDLKIHVAQRRPLADLAAVHQQSDTGKLPGKTILIP